MRIFATEFTDKGHSYYRIGDTDFTVDFSGGTSGGIPGVLSHSYPSGNFDNITKRVCDPPLKSIEI